MAKKEVDESIIKSEKATRKLAAYLKEHKLDPNKDWGKHPDHGEFIRKMQKRIKIGSEKAIEVLDKAKALKKPKVHAKTKTVKAAPLSYDYPEIDGNPLSPEQKKKFRTKMRDLTKSGIKPEEAQKKALTLVAKFKASALDKLKKNPITPGKVDSKPSIKEVKPSSKKESVPEVPKKKEKISEMQATSIGKKKKVKSKED